MSTAQQSSAVDSRSRQRVTLTFSVEGLAAREELLFKGYVRLLDHMTEHRWQYHEPSTTQRVDLLVADEQVQPTRCLQGSGNIQPILQLGISKTVSGPFYLSWPLKPYELETELNRIGRLINWGAVREPDVFVQASLPEWVKPEPVVQHYRLRQWPKPSLLTEPGSMRLATLLTGKAMSLEEVVFRSALPKANCVRFIAGMQAAGLIMHPDAAASHASTWVMPSAKMSTLLEQQKRPASLPAAKSLAQPGLLARIRMRFGIKSSH